MSQMAAFGWPSGGVNPDVTEGGLVLVARSTQEGIAALSLDQVFTRRYLHYLMHISVISSTTAAEVRVRLRKDGADAAGGTDYVTHNSTYQLASTTSSPARESTTSSYWPLRRTSGTAGVLSTKRCEIYAPALPQQTIMDWVGSDANDYDNHGISKHILSVAYDGLTVYPSAGEFDFASVRVYGYRL